MFERVLVPIDGGPRGEIALAVGERMADLWQARLDVLGLLELGDNIDKDEKAIEHQTAHLHTRGSVTMQTTRFTVGDDIADAVEAVDNTLVVMATSARSRSAALVESVADDVLRRVEAPALLIGPNAEVPPGWPTGPMFVCTDGSTFSEEIIPHAATVATGLEVDPWVITVADPADVPANVNPAVETSYPARVAGSLEPLMGKQVSYDVLHGRSPAKDIVDYANGRGAGLIALATHGHTGLKRLTMGSVAMAVAHDAKCPVLLARPKF